MTIKSGFIDVLNVKALEEKIPVFGNLPGGRN